MRAVNLIPRDQRRGATAPSRSGIGVYLLLGGLALVLVALTATVLTQNEVSDSKTELAKVNQDAAAAEATAARLKPYADFSALRQARVQTVSDLAKSRFAWDRAMREMARVMPSNVWLTSLVGTVAPGVGFAGGGGGASGALRGAINAPAIELVGCTVSQAEVSRVLARLRLMSGVQRVSLGASEKTSSSVGSVSSDGGAGSSGDDCRHGNTRYPKFEVVVFFDPPPAASAPTAPPASTPGSGQPAASGSTQPAPAPAAQEGAQ